MKKNKILWTKEIHQDELKSVAKEIALELTNETPFCLWLIGELGAGKTTISREILYSLGLDTKTQVLSPTFTYINEYQIKNKKRA